MSARRFLATALVSCLGCLPGAAAFAADTTPKDAGLYLSSPGKDGEAALVKLRGAMPSVKQKGIVKAMLLMGHSKPTLLAELSGDKSEVRATGGSPTFTIYLPPSSGGMEDAMRRATGDAPPAQARNGAEFMLVRLHPRDGSRVAEVGQEKGQHTRDTVACTSQSLGGSRFRVEPKDPLAAGEYAFYWGQQGFNGVLWDFGVDEK